MDIDCNLLMEGKFDLPDLLADMGVLDKFCLKYEETPGLRFDERFPELADDIGDTVIAIDPPILDMLSSLLTKDIFLTIKTGSSVK